MTWWQLLLLLVVGGAVSAVTIIFLDRRPDPPVLEVRDGLLRQHLLERYVVTLLSGESFSGLLAEVDDRTLVLRDADVLSADQAKKVDGDMVLRRDSIAYMQRPAT